MNNTNTIILFNLRFIIKKKKKKKKKNYKK